MKKTLQKLWLLAIILTAGVTSAWGADVTFGSDWNTLFGTSYSGSISSVKANSLTLSGSVDDVSFTATNGKSTNGYVKTSDFRAYNGYTITITAPTGSNITALSSTKGGKTFTSGISANVGTLSISNNAISWSGSSNSVVLSISGTVSFATITATYASEGQVTTPSITPNGGQFLDSQEVTLACTTDGAAIYYTLDGTDPTNASTEYTDAFTVTETTTVKAIAVKDGLTESNVASATFTKVEPYTTMAALFAKATEVGTTATDCFVTFTDWVVTGANSSNAFITDGTKGLVVYGSGHGFVAGDKLNGTVACKVQLYNGGTELISLTSSSAGLTVTKDGVATPNEVSIADLDGSYYGALIKVSNVTYSSSDGAFLDAESNSITPYKTLMTLPTFTDGKKYNVTGVYINYVKSSVTTKEIAPRTEGDIVETVTIAASGYSTFSAVCDVTIPEGVEAYYASGVSKKGLHMKPILTGKIPANTGVVIKGETGQTYTFETTTDAEAVGDNYLVATTTNTSLAPTVGTMTNYVLVDGHFCPFTGTATVAAGKAYLSLAEEDNAILITSLGGKLIFDFDDETGVAEVAGSKEQVASNFFDLMGRKVETPVKGNIYIVNGKKYIY